MKECPKCGSTMYKLACETCARAKSEAAMAAQQKQYAHFISSGRAPLIWVQTYVEGTNQGTKWHIQRLGTDRRHAMCGAFFKTLSGARPVALSRLAEFTPLCGSCHTVLQELIQPAKAAS